MPPRKSTKKRTTKRRSATQKGKGVLGDIHNFVRDNQLISKGILAAGHPEIANAAGQLGYGRRKKRTTKKSTKRSTMKTVVLAVPVIKKRATRRKTQKGRGIFDSLGGLLGSVGHGIGSAGYGVLSGLTGGRRSTQRGKGSLVNGLKVMFGGNTVSKSNVLKF